VIKDQPEISIPQAKTTPIEVETGDLSSLTVEQPTPQA
jgi:hypothetical protein